VVSLTTQHRDLLRIIINADGPVAAADIARRMGLTPRQVRYRLKTAEVWLAGKADGLHPAVLRLVDQTVRGAHAADKWVGVCGELAADRQAVPILVGLGVDELSVNVPAVPIVKAQVRSLAFSYAQRLAEEALTCGTAAEVRALVA
jgi:signal transduction protein with GAF and PtsI domain